jgi:hypothetical protein
MDVTGSERDDALAMSCCSSENFTKTLVQSLARTNPLVNRVTISFSGIDSFSSLYSSSCLNITRQATVWKAKEEVL